MVQNRVLIIFLVAFVLAGVVTIANADVVQPIMTIRADYVWNASGGFTMNEGELVALQYYPPNTFKFQFVGGLVLLDWMWFEGEVMTFNATMPNPSLEGAWLPFQVDYGFRGGIQHWGVRIGIDHWCYHTGGIYGVEFPERYGGVTSVFIEYDFTRMKYYK